MFPVEIWGTVSDWTMVGVTFVTAIFLFITLQKQIEAGREQRIKNDSDIIFLLINQLEVEYSNFTISYNQQTPNQARVQTNRYGYDAMSSYYKALKNDTRSGRLERIKNDLSTDDLLSLIRSFMLIRERVGQSTLSEDIKTLFYRKLSILYKTKFDFPMDCLITSLGSFEDPLVDEFKEFQQVNS